jgi:hypothetical protein
MRFWSVKSRGTIAQVFAWVVIALTVGVISTDGSFQAYGIYQKSIDYADFCIRLIKHWIMNLMG